jgi:hypothetical protein
MFGLQMIFRREQPETERTEMFVSELRRDLESFKPEGVVAIAIPTATGEHEVRPVRVIGHLDQPGEAVNPDMTCDIQVDPWDGPSGVVGQVGSLTIGALAAQLERYPDSMGVRVVVPLVNHETWTHRMLDIAQIGFTTGSGAGSGIQIITENWDLMVSQVIRTKPVEEGA